MCSVPTHSRFALALVTLLALFPDLAEAQTAGLSSKAVEESAYYIVDTVDIPNDVVLEVGGMALLPSGDIAVATRRGEIWLVENPAGWGSSPPYFRRFARGLHEPLGLAYRDGALYAAQRGELTRLEDRDGDGRADFFKTVYEWPLSGNYHEYSFGPVFRDDGSTVVTLNLGSLGQMESLAKWRGWMIDVSQDGSMQPIATGMRSPAGFTALKNGDLFYAENQGDWIGSGWLTHVEPGDFVGHPAGLKWADDPGSPVTLRAEDIPDTGEPMFEVAKRLPGLKPPAVWFPHGVLGVSTSGILEETTGGAFGPFAGQLFVGDQGHSKIMRVALEKVGGVYQGVVFPFREGFQSGVLRMIWDREGAMYVGMTSRGWDAAGGHPYGLQRLRWSGKMPFEAKVIRAMPDGFAIETTLPIDRESILDAAALEVTSFTYKYHSTYGSPAVNQTKHELLGVDVSDDLQNVRFAIDGLREGYIYEIKMPGLRSDDGRALLHEVGYYTLNRIPEGERLVDADLQIPAGRDDMQIPSNRSSSSRSAEQSVDDTPVVRPKRATTMPDDWDRPDLTITIGTMPGLRYDTDAFEVEPGERVELAFRNDDDMLHNLVIVLPGMADPVAEEAMSLGLKGTEMHYVPNTEDVLFHTALLQPGSSERIFFRAPVEPGEYIFVCTFPGHAITMRGIMRVVDR